LLRTPGRRHCWTQMQVYLGGVDALLMAIESVRHRSNRWLVREGSHDVNAAKHRKPAQGAEIELFSYAPAI
jgi:hypothetical protein